MRLLIVEDNPLFVDTLKRLLEEFTSHVEATGFLSEAMRLVESSEFDAIIVDLTLHDSTAAKTIEQLPWIRMRQPLAAIVVITGADGQSVRDRCLAAGADEFVEKVGMLHPRAKAIETALLLNLNRSPRAKTDPSFMAHVRMLETAVKSFAA